MNPLQFLSELRVARMSRTIAASVVQRQYLSLLTDVYLRTSPAVEVSEISFFGKRLSCFHRASVLSLFREVFLYQHYNPPIELGSAPVIIDAGGNIGLFTIYMSMIHPKSRIKTFEADPITFNVLRENTEKFCGGKSVELNCIALGNADGSVRLWSHRSNPNRCTHTICDEMADSDPHFIESSEIQLSRLSSFLHGLDEIDLLKIDCEGAEFDIITDLEHSGGLKKVRSMILEVHRAVLDKSNTKKFSGLLRTLEDHNFEYDIFAQGSRPFSSNRINDTFMLRAFKV
jgi:FkbM family methyltransferase